MLLYCIYPSQAIAKRFLFSRVPRVFLPLRVRFYFFTCIPHVILSFASTLLTTSSAHDSLTFYVYSTSTTLYR